MTAWLGWALAVAAVAAGYAAYGGRGMGLALTVVAFWMLLQFNQAVRVLKMAAGQPVGRVANAVMLHAAVHRGMRLTAVIKLTRSLGRRVADEPETFAWADAAGDEVRVQLHEGRVTASELKRAGA